MENINNGTDNKDNKTKRHLIPTEMDPFSRRLFIRETLKNMPQNVQNRVTLLKNLQVDYHKMQIGYYREIFDLEKKYHQKFKDLYEQRQKIVSGEIDPPEEEPKWKSDVEDFENDLSSVDFSDFLKDIEEIPENIKGVPDFWVSIFRNSDTLSQIVYEHDIPALKELQDIKIRYNDENSYTLEFYFNPNPYFSNQVLTKQYLLKNTVDAEYPFGFEGLEIYKCLGCTIDWKDKMNLTVKTVRKREKHRETGAMRITLKQVPRDSFFKFFSPPNIEADKMDGIDEDIQDTLRIDFEIGHFLREEVIPKAVLYYTGDIIDDEDDDESFESDDDSTGAGEPDENDMNIKRISEGINQSLRN